MKNEYLTYNEINDIFNKELIKYFKEFNRKQGEKFKKINDNFICEYNDCGWCYKKDSPYAGCVGVNKCYFQKKGELKMKNNTCSDVIISFRNIDQADRFYKAIINSEEFFDTGGDIYLNGKFIGHDVNVQNVKHIAYLNDEEIVLDDYFNDD